VFAKISKRVLSAKAPRLFFAEVDALCRQHGETVDGRQSVVDACELLRMPRLSLAAARWKTCCELVDAAAGWEQPLRRALAPLEPEPVSALWG
jgi:hypothetical protein